MNIESMNKLSGGGSLERLAEGTTGKIKVTLPISADPFESMVRLNSGRLNNVTADLLQKEWNGTISEAEKAVLTRKSDATKTGELIFALVAQITNNKDKTVVQRSLLSTNLFTAIEVASGLTVNQKLTQFALSKYTGDEAGKAAYLKAVRVIIPDDEMDLVGVNYTENFDVKTYALKDDKTVDRTRIHADWAEGSDKYTRVRKDADGNVAETIKAYTVMKLARIEPGNWVVIPAQPAVTPAP